MPEWAKSIQSVEIGYDSGTVSEWSGQPLFFLCYCNLRGVVQDRCLGNDSRHRVLDPNIVAL